MDRDLPPHLKPTVYCPPGRAPSCLEKHRADDRRPARRDQKRRAAVKTRHGGR